MDVQWDKYYERGLSLEDHLGNIGHHARFIAAILEAKPKRILEVGVGSGSMTAFLSHYADEVLGADYDANVLKIAEGANARFRGRARFVQADAFRLEDDLRQAGTTLPFDVVISQGLFEHFTDEEIRRMTREKLKVARRMIASVPSFWYPRQDVGNERLMKPEQWEEILRPAAANVRVTPYGHGRDRKNAWRWRPMQLMLEAW